jgi:hypothetical protein
MWKEDVLMLLAVCDHYDIDISTSFEVSFAAQKYRSKTWQWRWHTGIIEIESRCRIHFVAAQRGPSFCTSQRVDTILAALTKERGPEKNELRRKFKLDRNWK